MAGINTKDLGIRTATKWVGSTVLITMNEDDVAAVTAKLQRVGAAIEELDTSVDDLPPAFQREIVRRIKDQWRKDATPSPDTP